MAPGGNEITAARALLETLALDGLTVTGDAIHCQSGTAEVILAKGGDCLLALKANRPALPAEVAAYFADPPEALATHTATDAGHGRIETRHHLVTHDVDWLFSDRRDKDDPRMPGLDTLACVTATRDDGVPATRCYLSSARLTPERFAASVRAHWAIANPLHRVPDVPFDEDRARNRKGNRPENLATLRKLTRNPLRKTRPKLPVSRKRKRSGWSDAFATTVLSLMR